MPLGNPILPPKLPGFMPRSPFGAKAGMTRSPDGAMFAFPKFGNDPFTGRPITDPKEAEAMLDENTPQGQVLKQRIYTPPPEEAPAIPDMRRQLMRGRRGGSWGSGGGGGSGWSS